jgi:hypothetical protein
MCPQLVAQIRAQWAQHLRECCAPFYNGIFVEAGELKIRDRECPVRKRRLSAALSSECILWLLRIPNAPKSLEFLDSPTQYRRHAYARGIDRFSACMQIP